MKKLIILCFLLSSSFLWSQDLEIPNTPAFSILGYEPSAVMRPNSTKKLSTDILNSFDKEGKLLMNLGLEVAPYWLKSRDALTREQYLNPTGWQSFKQTFSISAATVKDSITGNNNLGTGFRVQLVPGKLTHDFSVADQYLVDLETVIAAISFVKTPAGNLIATRSEYITSLTKMLKDQVPDQLISQLRTKFTLLMGKYEDTHESMILLSEELNISYEEETDNLAKKVIELENKRTGFSLEFASAAKFITTSGNEGFQKIGFWANANNYFTETDAWTVTARWMTTVTDTTSTNFDIGIGYIKQGKNYNVSVEGMLRSYRTDIPDINSSQQPIIRVEKQFTYRLAAEVSYIIAENISFNISVGKNFEDPRLKTDSYFSILGLHYSLFNAQKVLPK